MNFVNEVYKISVLVPIYGVEQYIERCARSLFEQTYPNLEYVFVNDCTPDRSVDVLLNVMIDYPRRKDMVRIVNHEKNKGLAASRNTGLDNSNGEFICCVDSDDWLELDAIELLVKKQWGSKADIVTGSYLVHYEKEEKLLPMEDYQDKEQMVSGMMQRTWDHFIAGRLVRRSLFADNGLRWNEGFDVAEDRYMMTLLSYSAKGYDTIDDVVYHYERRNVNSITSCDREKRIKSNRQELGNVMAIEFFFKDKEAVYQGTSVRCVMEQLMLNLNMALAYTAKKEFQTIACMIDARNKDDLKLVGWKKEGLKGWCQHHYGWMRLNWLKGKAIRFIKKRMKCKNS